MAQVLLQERYTLVVILWKNTNIGAQLLEEELGKENVKNTYNMILFTEKVFIKVYLGGKAHERA